MAHLTINAVTRAALLLTQRFFHAPRRRSATLRDDLRQIDKRGVNVRGQRRHTHRTILSNPPFHVGVHTDYHATENLLQKAVKHLKSGGELRLVANSFLRYQPLIEEHLGPCRVKAEGQGFRIYSAKRR